MFERFISQFVLTDGPELPVRIHAESVDELLEALGGRTFDDGLYRVHTPASARAADELVRYAYPEFADRVACFAFDWLGRQFSTDSYRGAPEDPEIAMFEPGTAQMLEIPVAFSRFHDDALTSQTEAALAASFFEEWRTGGGPTPGFAECIGYRRPLYLGGDDVLANLELSDLDVYWTVLGQLRLRAKGLPVGTSIGTVTRDD